jgi:hypothetical protein
MPGEIDRVSAGLLRVAEDNVVDRVRTHAGSLNRRASRDDTELGCGDVFERAAEFAERSSRRRENDNFLR